MRAASTALGDYWVQIAITVPTGGPNVASAWPQWAYGVAHDALHFNKQVFVLYRGQDPSGNNLTAVACYYNASGFYQWV